MTYVYVKEESEEKLHLSRNPGQRAWAILIGLISIGIGAAYYSADYLLWKLAYLSGAVFVGLSCMDDWEDCIIDKSLGQITFKKQSLIQKLVNTATGQKLVVADVDDVIGVQVQAEDVRYSSGSAHAVVIQFAAGYSIGVTDTFTVGDKSEHESIAALIHSFLQLDLKQATRLDSTIQEDIVTSTEQPVAEGATGLAMATEDEINGDGDGNGAENGTENGTEVDVSSSSDDSFEQIDKVDLAEEDEKTEADRAAAV